MSSSLGGLRLDNVGLPLEDGINGAWVNGKEVPHGSPILDQDLENAEAIDDGFTGCQFFFLFSISFRARIYFEANDRYDLFFSRTAGPTDQVTAELQALYSSFQRCIDLREKYMKLSRQRLEDNPANYDGQYSGTPRCASNLPLPSDDVAPLRASPQFSPWEIYPPPPSPHWKERDPYSEATETTQEIEEREAKRREFSWEKVRIPGKEVEGKRKKYELDGNGVYQVYDEGEFTSSIFSLFFSSITVAQEY